MRKDMIKIICEHERVHGYGGKTILPKGTKKRIYKEYVNNDGELLQKKVSMSPYRTHGYNHKESAESYSVMKKFIISSVGEAWDDIYSDICKNIKRKDIIEKFLHFIALEVIIVDKKVFYEKPEGYSKIGWNIRNISEPTYVHPDTGIITLSPKRKPRYKRKIKNNVNLILSAGKGCCYCRDDKGIWWECWLSYFPPPTQVIYNIIMGKSYIYVDRYSVAYDVFLKTEVKDTRQILSNTYGDSRCYCYNRRQLNKKEIHKILKNRENKCQ